MKTVIDDEEVMKAAAQWAGGFPVVIEGERTYFSPNFYFVRNEEGQIMKGDRRHEEV